MQQGAFDETMRFMDRAEKVIDRSDTRIRKAYGIEDTNGHEPVRGRTRCAARPKRKTLWAKLKSMLKLIP